MSSERWIAMRLALKINGIPRLVAAVSGPGFLNAHLNLSDRPKDNDYSRVVRIVGVQTLETETVRLSWPEVDLQVGDTAELRLLDDGEGDAPGAVRRSSESPQNLLSHAELASEVLSVVSGFESRLMQMLDKSKTTESADEHKRFALAVGHVLAQLGESLLYPIYRRHKELVPDQLKGELL
jgi:hypothetical protein